jgi:hypothetical protein
MTAAEEWRPVVGYEGVYEVSIFGRVKRLLKHSRRGRSGVLKPIPQHAGRLYVCLSVHGSHSFHTIHSLVAAAFLGPRPQGLTINHINGDHTNNTAENLEYITMQENRDHASRMGLTAWGERNPNTKLSPEQVREIRAQEGKETILGLSKRFGVSRPVIKAVLRRETHRNVV